MLSSFFISFTCLDVDREDTVWSTWISIHRCLPLVSKYTLDSLAWISKSRNNYTYWSIIVSSNHEFLHFRNRFYNINSEIFHKDSFVRWLFQFQAILGIFGEQIVYLLHINLQKRNSNQKFFRICRFNDIYDMRECSWDDSLFIFHIRITHHRVCLSATLELKSCY